jgi:hypothetical protein
MVGESHRWKVKNQGHGSQLSQQVNVKILRGIFLRQTQAYSSMRLACARPDTSLERPVALLVHAPGWSENDEEERMSDLRSTKIGRIGGRIFGTLKIGRARGAEVRLPQSAGLWRLRRPSYFMYVFFLA